MVMDAINMLRSSDEEMAHAAVVEVGFLWSRSSALTSPWTSQMQQMLDLIRGGNLDEDEDDSSSEEVLAIFVLYEHCIVTFRRILRTARVQPVATVPALRRFFVISTIFSSRNDVQGLLRAELQDYLDDLNHQMIWIHQVIFLWSR